MAELKPYPLDRLARRMLAELADHDSVFGLPRGRFFLGTEGLDWSVRLHGHTAGTALGPAAGPHTQMAQNIVLAWLGGCRIMELKTVQLNDRLVIPRPCIDMATIGFNVEWSQELRLSESLHEYVKAAMLIEILRQRGGLEMPAALSRTLFDMSVGYDLAGIQSTPVRAFIDGMLDATAVVDELRGQLPPDLRDLDFPTKLSDTLTLSTFHGCPPDEIEKIIDWLLHEYGLHCIVKLNPTLLGPTDGRRILHDVLGYTDLVVPDDAYEKDTQWPQMVDFVGRLGDTAAALGRGFGVKFTNTQIVENHRDFFPAEERRMYMSGKPLHVLAMELVRRFRTVFGDRLPVSFSAGIDRQNFADALALGIVPITVCTDLLQPGGYGRASSYFVHAGRRMQAVGAADVDTWILRAYGCASDALADLDLPGDVDAACRTALAEGGELRAAAGEHFSAWRSATLLRNTDHYVAGLMQDGRYTAAKNSRPPRKIDSTLVLLDCLTCDKCLPVCPNGANFTFPLPPQDILGGVARGDASGWRVEEGAGGAATVTVGKKHQIGNFVDFCNDCGNCDVFCPELGGPYKLKARFFSTLDDLLADEGRPGIFIDGARAWARVDGVLMDVTAADGWLQVEVGDVSVRFDPSDPAGTLVGRGAGEIDLGLAILLDGVRQAVLSTGPTSYVAPL